MKNENPSNHPARYNPKLLYIFAQPFRSMPHVRTCLDPFAGTGERLKELSDMLEGRVEFTGIEIEPDYIVVPEIVRQGNALDLPFRDWYFHAILTSPTYGNRMADHHNAKDDSRRNTYRHRLGHELAPDNSGALQWGDEYRQFHAKAWKEAVRVLKPGGIFILNIKDHIRGGEVQPVTDWHINALRFLGLTLKSIKTVQLEGNKQGANGTLRVPYETVALFVKGDNNDYTRP